MGRIVKLKYRLEIEESAPKQYVTAQAWHGRATKLRLEEWVQSYHKSLQYGGANHHLSRRLGYVPLLSAARIVNQDTGDVVSEWKSMLFMAF